MITGVGRVVSFKNTLKISMAFIGLVVGAGFATGQEVVQYFVSFGISGVWGAVIAGLVMAIAGAAILQIGSYFLANEHRMVFRNVSHPIVSILLDVSVTITLFAIGFVMLAGSGANLSQQFDMPAWIGSLIMLILVMVTGLLDVDKVSNIISLVTPLIIIAVLFAFIYTMFNLPDNLSDLSTMAQEEESPVKPWILSALNYDGLALILGVSMSLVIGGNNTNPKEAGVGGFIGGLAYMLMLSMSALILLLNIDKVSGSDVPMLALIKSISEPLSYVMVFIIFAMVYNTCIGMFYALGRRLTANHRQYYRPVFLVTCVLGFIVSFVGFDTLMTYVYPVLGFIGMFMVVVLVAWWIKSGNMIGHEAKSRQRIHELVERYHDDDREFEDKDSEELKMLVRASNIGNYELVETVTSDYLSGSSDDEDAETDEQESSSHGASEEKEDSENSTSSSHEPQENECSEVDGDDEDENDGKDSKGDNVADEKTRTATESLIGHLNEDWRPEYTGEEADEGEHDEELVEEAEEVAEETNEETDNKD